MANRAEKEVGARLESLYQMIEEGYVPSYEESLFMAWAEDFLYTREGVSYECEGTGSF